MTIINTFVGQCGLQIGEELWNLVDSERRVQKQRSRILNKANSRSTSAVIGLALEEWMLGPVMYVDTEPRVLRRPSIARGAQLASQARSGGWGYEHHSVHQYSGCGNNWALGYHRASHRSAVASVWGKDNAWQVLESAPASTLADLVEEKFRLQVEALDMFEGTSLFMSLAGGTGSGVGSCIAEVLRQNYPKAYLTALVVAPSRQGDTPLQHYNFCLALSKCQEVADCIIFKDNDQLLTRARDIKGHRANELSSESIPAMNRLIVSDLRDVLLSDAKRQVTGMSSSLTPMELTRCICPMPSAKIIDVTSVGRSQVLDKTLTKSLPPSSASQRYASSSSMGSEEVVETLVRRFTSAYASYDFRQATNNPSLSVAKYIALTAVIHAKFKGQDSTAKAESPLPSQSNYQQNVKSGKSNSGTGLALQSMLDAQLKKHCRIVEWNPEAINTSIFPTSPLEDEAWLTIASNGPGPLPSIVHAVSRADTMFNHRAYLHWYQKYGCNEEDLEEAFHSCRNIISTYGNLLS